ncbi:MAG: succinate--CoA ligase subunit alpha, partial [Bacteroidota bacterium]|nr:succinate--CoA ligase subunit alpha [Bacteroidota bacterium]
MSILIDQYTRVLVQGITGRDGSFHASRMKVNGTNIVAGVSPGKGGSIIDEIPVFNTLSEAVEETYANTSIIFVPASFAKDAILEATDAGIELIITITEGIPTRDIIEVLPFLHRKGAKLIGPNCPGVISPGKCMVGIMPPSIFSDGPIGLMSRSGTLTYEVVHQLTQTGLGQTTCVGIGGDPVAGLYYQELLEMFENDPDTEAIVLIGEIGGDAEERAAQYI